MEEQSRYFKPERRLKFRVSRRLPEQISFSSDGIDAGLRVRRLQLLQSSSFSLEKREKSKSSRTTEEMFNFSTEELLGRLMELLLPQLLKEMSRSFSFLHEERSRPVSYTHLDVYKRQELPFQVEIHCTRQISLR